MGDTNLSDATGDSPGHFDSDFLPLDTTT